MIGASQGGSPSLLDVGNGKTGLEGFTRLNILHELPLNLIPERSERIAPLSMRWYVALGCHPVNGLLLPVRRLSSELFRSEAGVMLFAGLSIGKNGRNV